MNILIQIETQDKDLDADLLKAPQKVNSKFDLPASTIFMRVQMGNEKKGTLLYNLTFAKSIDPGLIANWLYAKIGGRATRIWMDRIEVQFNKNEIEQRIISKKNDLG
jgi:hypothetical protein